MTQLLREAPSPWQVTIRGPVRMCGIGIHTGRESTVTVQPADQGAGLSLISAGVRIPVRPESVVDTRRCTALGCDGARVETVEHLLSALHGLGVDNAEIVVDGPEVPILDGSAKPWVDAITDVGLAQQDALAPIGMLNEPVALRDGDSWIVATPADRFRVTCVSSFDHPLLGTAVGSFNGAPAIYAREIASARTFGFAAEVEALLASGRALGGSLDNALIVYDNHFSSELRLPDEWMRHKALDLWGDLAVLGVRLHADVTVVLPGHRANAAFARCLAGHLVRQR